MQYLFSSRTVGLSGVLAVLLIGTGASSAAAHSETTPVDTSACAAAAFSQPFQSLKDQNWYTLAPGQTPGHFSGDGWTLSGGAQVVQTRGGNGEGASVLDLPSGAKAISPPMCVTSDYPKARTMVRNVVGNEGVRFFVSYAGTKTWDAPKGTGQVKGSQDDWTASSPINIHPDSDDGWQLVRFTFVPGGSDSHFQIYDFYVDPRMRG